MAKLGSWSVTPMRMLVAVLSVLYLVSGGQESMQPSSNAAVDDPVRWTNVSGGFKSIYDMQTIDRNNVWLATLGGLAHFDGRLWHVVADERRTVNNIAVVGDDQVWYTSGSELLYFGGGGSSLRMQFDDPIADIVMTSPDSGWLITSGIVTTMLWFYNGTTWELSTEIPGEYTRVDIDSGGGLWLAGESGLARVNDDGALTRWPMVGVADVDMLSPDAGWAVGGHCGGDPSSNRQMIWQYQAGNWQISRQVNEPGLLSVTALSRDHIVAAGSSWTVVQSDGSAWTVVDSNPSDCYQTTLVSESSDMSDAVLVGGTSRGTTLVSEVDNAHLRVLFGRETYHRLFMTAEGEGWILSWDHIARITSGRLEEVIGPDEYGSWSDVIVDSLNRVWIGGFGLYYREGATWIRDSQIASHDVIRFRKDVGQRIWLLACSRRNGPASPRETALFVRTGNAWRLAYARRADECPVDMDIDEFGSAWILYANGVWRIAADGTENYDSGRGLGSALSCIAASGGRAWIGAQGAMFEWHDSAWKHVDIDDRAIIDSDAMADVAGMWAAGPADVWAAASDGGVLHYDGQSWQLDGRSMTINRALRMYNWQMFGVQVLKSRSPHHQVWVVGTTSTIMKRDYEHHVPDKTPVATTTPVVGGDSTILLPMALQAVGTGYSVR